MVIVSKIAKDTKFRQLHIRCPVCRARLCDTILETHQAKIIAFVNKKLSHLANKKVSQL